MMLRYLKSRLLAVAVLLLFCLVFAVVFSLCGLPLNAVAYAFVICVTLGAVMIAVDYALFARRCAQIERLIHSPEDAAEQLPPPRQELEAAYQKLTRTLRESWRGADTRRREQYGALVRYCTLWAHQIKTPIAAMGLILQDMDSPEGAQLRSELRRVEQYVEMMMCYVRLDSDSTDYLFRRCSLDEVIRGQLRLASPLFIRGKIALDFQPTGFHPLTDEKWLGFVLGQILSNALKYTPAGGKITLRMAEPGVLEIADSGVGIPPEDLPRVTQWGFTGENGRMEQRSTGLGLYLCQRTLDALGHGLEISSRRGEGTRVRIDLRSTQLDVE